MIFGGLEFVAGGYLIHRHYKHKNQKKKQEHEVEVEARRHNTFPGTKPSSHYSQQNYQQCQQPLAQQQKYACYAPPMPPRPQPQHHHSYPAQPDVQPRPNPPQHAQTFTIPRRPVPDHKPQIIIEPSLHRTDSFATLSRMPIANGYRPQDLPEEDAQASPPRRHATGGLQPAITHGVYGNAGYSVSTPALGATPTSPALTYTMGTSQEAHAAFTTDDNWETYDHRGQSRLSYAPTEASTQLGERDPPPPYTP
jgi:hypothetical protein